MKYKINDKVKFYEHGHTGNIIKGVIVGVDFTEECWYDYIIESFEGERYEVGEECLKPI